MDMQHVALVARWAELDACTAEKRAKIRTLTEEMNDVEADVVDRFSGNMRGFCYDLTDGTLAFVARPAAHKTMTWDQVHDAFRAFFASRTAQQHVPTADEVYRYIVEHREPAGEPRWSFKRSIRGNEEDVRT
jgi:hypothetical protein